MRRLSPVPFVVSLALAVIGAGFLLPSAAQQAQKSFRIGILSPAASPSTKAFDALREGLRELGYIEGANTTIEYRLAAGDYGKLPAMAADLVRLPVDLIVTDSGIYTKIAQKATHTIPIVAATAGADPVATGIAASLAHPGGNVTGFAGFQLSGKRLQLLKEALPAISRVAVLWNPAPSPGFDLRSSQEAAPILGLQLRLLEIASPDQFAVGFEAAITGGAEALIVLPDGMFWNERRRIVALAAQHRLPAIYEEREYAHDGGLLSYGRNVSDNFRQAAGYIDKILRGARPGDLPIQQPTKFDLVVNLRTAKELGLTIPPTILARADEVIE
jgi:putative ABC transport system substrate-binding protein